MHASENHQSYWGHEVEDKDQGYSLLFASCLELKDNCFLMKEIEDNESEVLAQNLHAFVVVLTPSREALGEIVFALFLTLTYWYTGIARNFDF